MIKKTVTTNETSIIITAFLFCFFFALLSFIHSFSLSLSLFTAEERQTKAMHLHLNDYRDTSKKKTVMMTVVAASTECAQH
jgi:hypothetical protein